MKICFLPRFLLAINVFVVCGCSPSKEGSIFGREECMSIASEVDQVISQETQRLSKQNDILLQDTMSREDIEKITPIKLYTHDLTVK